MHTCLFRQVRANFNRSWNCKCRNRSISYDLDLRMRSKRSNAPPETARARGFATRVGESGATPEPHRPRPDAERYVHTVHDPMVPIGGIAVGIGGSLRARNDPKKRSIFAPRGAFGCAAVRCSPEVEIAIRCRAAPSRPSRIPCEVGPTTARHRRCPFSPSGQGVETCKSAY